MRHALTHSLARLPLRLSCSVSGGTLEARCFIRIHSKVALNVFEAEAGFIKTNVPMQWRKAENAQECHHLRNGFEYHDRRSLLPAS